MPLESMHPLEALCLRTLTAAGNARAAKAYGDAERLLSLAPPEIQRDPRVATLRAIILAETGRSRAAIEGLETVIRDHPTSVQALTWLATIYRMEGNPRKAIDLCDRALQVEPGNADALAMLGLCYVLRQQYRRAAEVLRQATDLSPGGLITSQGRLTSLFYLLANSLWIEGDLEGAVDAARRAIEAHPSQPENHVLLGELQAAVGDADAATKAFDKAFRLAGGSAERLVALSSEFAGNGNLEMAAECLRRAQLLAGGNAQIRTMLGDAELKLGRFDAAVESFSRALELDPAYSRAFLGLATARRATPESRHVFGPAAALADRSQLARTDRIALRYALGKVADDLGEYEAAIGHYDEANRLSRETLGSHPLDRNEVASRRDGRRLSYTQAFFTHHREVGNSSERPILIVGMIRSGTTLLEQMLSAHPEIGGAGELPFLLMRERDVVDGSSVDAAAADEAQHDYLNVLARMAPGSRRVIDKLPMNYRALGFAHLLFPNARIIHLRRNPAATCLSIWMTPFDGPLAFGHDRDNLCFFYRQYLLEMNHWRSVLPPDRFMELDYERLVDLPDRELRRIIEFLNLTWDPACVQPELSQAAIRTPSAWQARQPVYARAAERWRQYADWIPEFVALDAELNDS